MAIDTPAKLAVLGAGPIGLETALYARYLGYEVEIFERGRIAENVLRWGHVRMFSPFHMNCSPLGLAALKAQDERWQPPPKDALLTGQQYAEQYLIPLSQSDLLVDSLREQTEVIAVGRETLLKGELIGDDTRADEMFRILLQSTDPTRAGYESTVLADAVIDTTGTFGNPNWLGAGGIPALGERAARDKIDYGLPDIVGRQRTRFAGRSTLVIGSGYSAATNVVALAELAREATDTWVTWITRRPADPAQPEPIPTIPGDRLPERNRLARLANQLAADDSNHITHWPGRSVTAISWHADLGRFVVRLTGDAEEQLEFDAVIANVGYRPDDRIYQELQFHQCYATDGPMKLAAANLGQASADCLDQRSCGPETLINPEPDFYVLGSKSYGRNSRFLISVGLDQIREVFTIIGDRANLDLYATMSGLLP